MFRTLRSRVIWSQVLPILLVLPVMGIVLIYTLEKQILIPRLAQTLQGDSRLLAEITSAEFELWGNPILFEQMVSRVQLDPAIQVMFLDNHGYLLYSSDPNDAPKVGMLVLSPGVDAARAGQEIVLTTYSIFQVRDVLIDVYEPVTDSSNEVVGIVRLAYRVESLYETFGEMRWEIGLVVALAMAISLVIGSILAISITRPVRQVTQAIYDLASGRRSDPLEERGPDELRSQAQAVNYLLEQLHSLEKARKQLLANLVHELGRPLGAVRSAIHALQNGAEKDPILYQDLTHGMDEETGRLQRLLEEVAGLYDQAMGGMELNLRRVDLTGWLGGVLSPWQSAAVEKGLNWQAEIAPDLPVVTLDADRMAQVLGNLLSNAVKYTRSGGAVRFIAQVVQENLVFRVEDTGAGIQPDEVDKVSQPFFRGEQGKRIKQGMGLGLTIALEITRAHDGTLEISSHPGEGSQFTVRIPIRISQPTPEPRLE